ncbi:MAG: ATPase, T2SS/T4P/T4SS family, partial [Aureliella sp.]
MHAPLAFDDLDLRASEYAAHVVDRILQTAVMRGASDIHIESQGKASVISLKWRIDGDLLAAGSLPDGESTSILARIKAMARLITYRYDIPQEGRMTFGAQALEARVGTLPTLHGERIVIRLIAKQTGEWLPEQLGLPSDILTALRRELNSDSGVILLAGTAGSGKTTTAYASLRAVLQDANLTRSVVTLEDPIEAELAGACQSQIN